MDRKFRYHTEGRLVKSDTRTSEDVYSFSVAKGIYTLQPNYYKIISEWLNTDKKNKWLDYSPPSKHY